MKKLSHVNENGEAHMVDVSNKAISKRSATALCYVEMLPSTLQMITEGTHKKGDVFGVARIAGIQAAKKCAELIPLCHPLLLSHISVNLNSDVAFSRVKIDATCELTDKTGVEMEALLAVSVAALTLYDMCKAVDKNMKIVDVQLISKTGGKSWNSYHE